MGPPLLCGNQEKVQILTLRLASSGAHAGSGVGSRCSKLLVLAIFDMSGSLLDLVGHICPGLGEHKPQGGLVCSQVNWSPQSTSCCPYLTPEWEWEPWARAQLSALRCPQPQATSRLPSWALRVPTAQLLVAHPLYLPLSPDITPDQVALPTPQAGESALPACAGVPSVPAVLYPPPLSHCRSLPLHPDPAVMPYSILRGETASRVACQAASWPRGGRNCAGRSWTLLLGRWAPGRVSMHTRRQRHMNACLLNEKRKMLRPLVHLEAAPPHSSSLPFSSSWFTASKGRVCRHVSFLSPGAPATLGSWTRRACPVGDGNPKHSS